MINHAAGSHGMSGIFVKYDTSSLTVTVTEQHMPLWQFLVRLCGIVGGIFSTTGESGFSVKIKSTVKKKGKTSFCCLVEGMLHGLVGCCFHLWLCRFKIGACRAAEVEVTFSVKSSLLPTVA